MEKNEKKLKSEYSFPMKLGKYTLVDLIGKGGMGEIFIAKDPVCNRTIAIKRILPKHVNHSILRKRFLNEPKIAAQLSHPSIIPIYDLYEEANTLYYTMPYIEGETLLRILIKTRQAQERGLPPHAIGSSIQTLMLMFLNICHGIEHTHKRGFLHRDIKPENIMVGKFSEVVILDWGVSTRIGSAEDEESGIKEIDQSSLGGLTKPGKTVGTVEFMAPERALGAPSTIKTDIYSLGATLYYMLTLYTPFKRPNSLKEWRKKLKSKAASFPLDPQERAPDREITPHLSRITMKCLNPNPKLRFNTVQELIDEIERYIKGHPEWISSGEFHIKKARDWKFQENILISKHMAISQYTGSLEWVMLMLSKESYSGNIQLKTKVKLRQECSGLGFVMCLPEASQSRGLETGYLIWIGSKNYPRCQLFRSNIEVINLEEIYLNPEIGYTITLEKQDNVLRLLIDDKVILSYVSHIPLVGGHFGLVLRDDHFDMDPITLLSGSQNVLINCLSIPDAFLMNKYYDKAISEYQRIAHSFTGRSEGREATFRAGITRIEQGKNSKDHAEEYFNQALNEFEKLHQTSGAPLEYLGKSLTYRAQKRLKDEVHALEHALYTYPLHPLKSVLEEHVTFRLHESAQTDRIGAYMFTLLTLQLLPNIYEKKEAKTLIQNLILSWENLPFLAIQSGIKDDATIPIRICLQLAFWLANPENLYKLILAIPKESPLHFLILENGLTALYVLQYPSLIHSILKKNYKNECSEEFLSIKSTFDTLQSGSNTEEKFKRLLNKGNSKILDAFIEHSLTTQSAEKMLPHFEKNEHYESQHIKALLMQEETTKAQEKLMNHSPTDTQSPYYVLHGCLIARMEGEKGALEHFKALNKVPYPRTTALLGHFLKGHISLNGKWFKEAFLWEKVQLLRQLVLYYTCLKEVEKARHFEAMIDVEFTKSQLPINFI